MFSARVSSVSVIIASACPLSASKLPVPLLSSASGPSTVVAFHSLCKASAESGTSSDADDTCVPFETGLRQLAFASFCEAFH
ncbi:hypothetical protein PR003_g4363 [Phytophthora rubi]|uniref:Uncharacterized protein n=1 Tax=Phytophthora rubi TaxID=129364 RepID=A0A6A3IMH4_9STRA|nr:hypothetical protein PR002_g23724 [Phytophthora rubi]KAE8984136.1 hypothetical protein PR001_g23256 [Phytophthora rubi]KAE9352479.1 hypothetical protein PR003_g4363 [Phytophthora rubi]